MVDILAEADIPVEEDTLPAAVHRDHLDLGRSLAEVDNPAEEDNPAGAGMLLVGLSMELIREENVSS